MADIKVVNVAVNGGALFVAFDRMPEFVYKFSDDGNHLYGEDGMFRSAFMFRQSHDKAISGSMTTFQIDPFDKDRPGVYENDGKFYLTAQGDWWVADHPDVDDTFIGISYSTPEKLRNMYSYYAGVVKRDAIDAWMENNEVTKYWDYDKQLRGK